MHAKGIRGSMQIRMHRDQKMAALHWYNTKGVYSLSIAGDPI